MNDGDLKEESSDFTSLKPTAPPADHTQQLIQPADADQYFLWWDTSLHIRTNQTKMLMFTGVHPRQLVERRDADQRSLTAICGFYFLSDPDMMTALKPLSSCVMWPDLTESCSELLDFLSWTCFQVWALVLPQHAWVTRSDEKVSVNASELRVSVGGHSRTLCLLMNCFESVSEQIIPPSPPNFPICCVI